jgi:hypothetical protein
MNKKATLQQCRLVQIWGKWDLNPFILVDAHRASSEKPLFGYGAAAYYGKTFRIWRFSLRRKSLKIWICRSGAGAILSKGEPSPEDHCGIKLHD